MDHSEAVAKRLPESYLLGELTPEQREAYEEHYFTCQECAADVTAGAALVANVREVLRAEPASSAATDSVAGAGWFAWLRPGYALAALALVFAVLVYQNSVTIPRLKGELSRVTAPQALATFSFIGQGARGDSPPISIPYQDRPFILYGDITPNSDFVSYTCTIQSESGAAVWPGVTVSAEQAKDTISLLVPGSLLKPDKYDLIIRGNPAANKSLDAGVETAQHHPFVVESKNEGTTKQ